MLLNPRTRRRAEAGFTLVELLVTMLIVTVGLLGLAKLQATAVSNTAVSRTRALMTYQAESLAGMIRANRAFWVTSGSATTWPAFNVTSSGTVTNTGMTTVTLGSCVNTTGASACTPQQLAYDDMYAWAYAFNDPTNTTAAFPGASASITCVPVTGSTCGANPVSPHGYDITLTWNQKIVAMNRSTVNSSSMTTPVTMVMHVQP
jgi:type IV pilus assembly protein PilV